MSKKKDEVIKDEPKKVKPKKAAPRKKRVQIDRQTEVVFMNNTNGRLFYKCPKTHFVFNMNQHGDTDYITVEQLLIMNNTSQKMLKELWILLVDTADEDVSLDDVLRYLGIDNLYKDEINPEDIDNFILKSKDDGFATTLKKMNKILSQKVVERSVALYREGKFDSISKVRVIREFTGNEDLFE